MSTDDPGWDAQTPFDDEVPAPAPPSAAVPPAPAPRASKLPGLGSGGSGPNQKTLLTAGGGVLAVVVIVVLVIVLTHHNKKPSHSTTTGSIATYDAAADRVCTRFKPELTAAGNSGNLSTLVTDYGQELAALESIPSPTQDAAEQHQWISSGSSLLETLQSGDISSFNSQVDQADTLAGKLGMKVCNYGH